jgi:hypothetical protein
MTVHSKDVLKEFHRDERRVERFNRKVGEAVTNAVATMWCAYAFALIALISFPQALHDTFVAGFKPLPLITWVAQTFLQLVLLAVILYGQNLAQVKADARAEATFRNTKEAETRLTDILQAIATRGEENARMEAQNNEILKRLAATRQKGTAG